MNNDKIIDNKEKWEDLEEAVQVPDTEIPRKRNPFKLSDEQIAEMQRQLNRNKLLKKNKDDKEEKDDDILRENIESKEPTLDDFIEELEHNYIIQVNNDTDTLISIGYIIERLESLVKSNDTEEDIKSKLKTYLDELYKEKDKIQEIIKNDENDDSDWYDTGIEMEDTIDRLKSIKDKKEESIEKLEEDKTFSGIEFEKNIPHTMRFKEYDIIYEDPYTLEPNRNDLYWVTQQFFGKEELKQFAKAFKELNIFDRALVTVRDLSTYVISTDEAKGVLAIIDKDGNINDTGYVNTLKEIGYNFDYETGEWED